VFETALEIANRYTFPFVGLRRRPGGAHESTLAAFVVLGSNGWVLTAAHVVDQLLAVRRESGSGHGVSAHGASGEREADGVSGAAGADHGGVTRLRHSEVWALPGFERSRPRLAEARVDRLRDLALVRLEPVDDVSAGAAPVFRDTAAHPIRPGLSVCRLGYPFYEVKAEFDEETNSFKIAPRAFPVPRFALDGIVARFHQRSTDDGRVATFVETSTPGLRGQSGGPLLDSRGRICGIQSHTVHLDLGFDARFKRDGAEVVERQFLNVGAAIHVQDVLDFLDEQGVPHGDISRA
jgi:hypothetical protein